MSVVHSVLKMYVNANATLLGLQAVFSGSRQAEVAKTIRVARRKNLVDAVYLTILA
jgi:hypothetical protein